MDTRTGREQQHRCTVCGRNTVKLYRYYASPLRDAEIFCRTHAPAGQIQSQYLVPLCEDTDGSVWGYTSVPADAIARFAALPDD
jgi:hypothetical protein